MKKTIAALTLMAMTAFGVQNASAGDREWATAGKVLTGLFAFNVLNRALEPGPAYATPAYYASPPVYVQQAPVVQAAPVVQPAPTVVYQQPVYVQPAPVYLQPAPVYY